MDTDQAGESTPLCRRWERAGRCAAPPIRRGAADPKFTSPPLSPRKLPVLSGGLPGGNRIEGIGMGYVVPLWKPEIVDEIMTVSAADAMAMARRLAREEGLFAGASVRRQRGCLFEAGSAPWAECDRRHPHDRHGHQVSQHRSLQGGLRQSGGQDRSRLTPNRSHHDGGALFLKDALAAGAVEIPQLWPPGRQSVRPLRSARIRLACRPPMSNSI